MVKELSDLIGTGFHPYYGTCQHVIKIGDNLFEAVEDEDDGYRSFCEEIKRIEPRDGLIFPAHPIAIVEVVNKNHEDDKTLLLRDAFIKFDWLEVGTSNTNDYYPYFTFRSEALSPTAALMPRDDAPIFVSVRTVRQHQTAVNVWLKANGDMPAVIAEAEADKNCNYQSNPTWGSF